MSNHDNTRKILLQKYPSDTQGTWKILGEDPNCELGGHHHEPELGVVSGTYHNVVEYALKLPHFFNWGAGGRIILITPPKNLINVDKLFDPRVLELEDERTQLQKRLVEIENEIVVFIGKKQ